MWHELRNMHCLSQIQKQEKFQCRRINQLDKRYRSKNRTSFIENLAIIKEKGIDNFLEFESKRRTCRNCGSILSVHRDKCLSCEIDLKNAV
jgi:NifB/MoaA-like Fe-S oxidoreductase